MRSLVLVLSWFACSCYSAQGAIVVLNGLTHIHNTAQGGEFQGKVSLKNDGKAPVRVLIYGQDLSVECGKSAEYLASGAVPLSLNAWITLGVDERTLAPGEEYEVSYTVKIPEEGVSKGSYWQVLMVEGADPVREEVMQGVTVNSKVRYAIQVIVNVGGFENPALAFENLEIKKGDSSALEVVLKNSGTYAAVVHLTLELHDAEGRRVKKLESSPRRIYPSFCNSFSIPLEGIPPGKYAGVLVADNGKDLFGSNLSLEL